MSRENILTYDNKISGITTKLFGNVKKVTIHRVGGRQITYLLTKEQVKSLEREEIDRGVKRFRMGEPGGFLITNIEDYRNIYFYLSFPMKDLMVPAYARKKNLFEHFKMAWWEIFKKQDEQLKIIHMINVQVNSGLEIERALQNLKDAGGLSEEGRVLINDALKRLDELLDALKYVADEMEESMKVRSKIIQAFTYPAITLSISVIFMLIVLLYIFPIFQNVFESLNAKVPLPITVGCMIGEILRNPFVAITLVLLIPFGTYFVMRFSTVMENILESLVIKYRIFGPLTNLMQTKCLIQFCRIILTCLKIGSFRHIMPSSKLSFSQIRDPDQIIQNLKVHCDPVNQKIWGILNSEARWIIKSWIPGKKLDDSKKAIIMSGLNSAIQKSNLFTLSDLENVKLPMEAKRIFARGLGSMPNSQIQRFNRLALESIYPNAITSGRYFTDVFKGHIFYDLFTELSINLELGRGLKIAEVLRKYGINEIYCSFFAGLEADQEGSTLLTPKALKAFIKMLEADLEATTHNITSLLEPFFTVAIGASAGAFIIYVFYPLLELVGKIG